MNELNSLPEFEVKVRKAVSVPGANPEFVNRLRSDLARRTLKTKPQWTLRPAWAIAFVLAVIVLIISAPRIVAAFQQLFGYIPGLGLVDNSSDLRVLAEPVSVTREGVTLTVTQAIIYPDHVQIIFEWSGVAPEDDSYQGADTSSTPTAFCGGVNIGELPIKDGDPVLRLPDGTIIERLSGSDEFPENVFYARPVFKTAIPANVNELTLVLKCIYGTRLGVVPEDWEIPLKLTAVPAGTVVGKPVIEVAPSEIPNGSDQGIAIRLEKVVPQADAYSFFFSITSQQKDESMIALYPASAYLIDSTGQKIAIIYKNPWHPGDAVDLWELQTIAKPAYGPYTLVVDKLIAYYNTNNAGFEFDPGQMVQPGQSWTLDQTIVFGSHAVKVTSAQVDEKDLSGWGLSKNVPGITFTFQPVNGEAPLRLGIMDNSAEHNQAGQVITSADEGVPADAYHAGLFYEKGIPTEKIQVTINEASRLITGHWEFQWESPEQNGVTLLSPADGLISNPGINGLTAFLERVIKLDQGYLFYIHMASSPERPGLDYIEPGEVYGIDSTGQRIPLTLDAPQWFLAGSETLWQYHTTGKIAEGPIRLVIEKATVHYTAMPLDTPPTGPMIEANSFTFDVGAAPETGQAWTLNQAFEISGYKGKVISARAVAFDPSQHPEIKNAQGYTQGYEFTVQADDPAVQMNLWLEITPNADSWVPMIKIDGKPGSTFTQTILFQGDLPKNSVKVTFYGISVLADDTWEMNWTLPKQ